jgi:hypothetical protein
MAWQSEGDAESNVNDRVDFGTIAEGEGEPLALVVARVIAPAGWALAAVGFFGPWIAHETAALTLSGVDMGEFVKFLPPVLDGSLEVLRQLFYLPPMAVVFGIAMLVCSQKLRYPGPLRLLSLALAVPVSLQLLPPAWSPFSLMTPEFRLQAVTMVVLWLLLAGTWLWGRLSLRVLGILTGSVALGAAILSPWQLMLTKPAIDEVYSSTTSIGWGLYVCIGGLGVMVIAGVLLAFQGPDSREA